MSDVIARDNYFDRQVLRTQDFTDEQAYHVAMRRKHLVAGHSWGIVSGLELVVTGGSPYVQPGVAIDGYGREIVLTDKTPVPVTLFSELNRSVLDVVLVYGLRPSDQAPPGYAVGGDTAGWFYRWAEVPTLRLQAPPEEDPPDRRAPPDVPEGDCPFPPSRSAPDDPGRQWPVVVGQLLYDPSKPDAPYIADMSDRPYAGLVGERLDAPSGRARVQIGAEQQADPRRFAVWIEDPKHPGVLETEPRLRIDQAGDLQLRGNAEIGGGLTVGDAVQLEPGQPPPTQSPWSLYRVAQSGDPTQTLRIEIPSRAAAGGPVNEVAIGRWGKDASGKESFQACLTVRDDCTVTIAGDLIVQGTVRAGGGLITGQLSQDARRIVLSSQLSGVGGASALLEKYYRSGYTGLGAEAAVETLAPVLTRDSGMQEVARSLAENPAQRAAFAAVLQQSYPELADRLRQDLAAPAAGAAGPERQRPETVELREGETEEIGLTETDLQQRPGNPSPHSHGWSARWRRQ
jgi:hypothetical protein